jgi:alpha-D-ribose 1-methylphosphonate 5-triphosphate diphosphatase
VRIVSLMDHTPGQRQFRDPLRLREYLSGKYGMTETDIEAHFEHLTGLQNRYGAEHETGAVEHARRLGAVLASHDDTTIEQVAVSADHGVTLAEFPTTQEAALACGALGIAVMMGAPNLLRGGSHSGNVAAQELADEGLLDILSSDYVPSSLLLGAIRLGEAWSNLAAAFATVTSRPARAARLADRGRLGLGLRADLIQVRLAPTARVRAAWVCGSRIG